MVGVGVAPSSTTTLVWDGIVVSIVVRLLLVLLLLLLLLMVMDSDPKEVVRVRVVVHQKIQRVEYPVAILEKTSTPRNPILRPRM